MTLKVTSYETDNDLSLHEVYYRMKQDFSTSMIWKRQLDVDMAIKNADMAIKFERNIGVI